MREFLPLVTGQHVAEYCLMHYKLIKAHAGRLCDKFMEVCYTSQSRLVCGNPNLFFALDAHFAAPSCAFTRRDNYRSTKLS